MSVSSAWGLAWYKRDSTWTIIYVQFQILINNCSIKAGVLTLTKLPKFSLSNFQLSLNLIFTKPFLKITKPKATKKATKLPTIVAIAAPFTPSSGNPRLPLIKQ